MIDACNLDGFLYGSVYKDALAVCKVDCCLHLTVHMFNNSRLCPCLLGVGFVFRFIGSSHNAVFLSLPPDNTSFPL